jgi:hypothetical protein
MDQWDRIEDKEISSCSCPLLILDKGAKNIYGEKTATLPTVLKILISTCRRLKLDAYLSRCTKINAKWI